MTKVYAREIPCDVKAVVFLGFRDQEDLQDYMFRRIK